MSLSQMKLHTTSFANAIPHMTTCTYLAAFVFCAFTPLTNYNPVPPRASSLDTPPIIEVFDASIFRLGRSLSLIMFYLMSLYSLTNRSHPPTLLPLTSYLTHICHLIFTRFLNPLHLPSIHLILPIPSRLETPPHRAHLLHLHLTS